MGYSTPTKAEVISARRLLNMGPPNSGKSESLITWPRPAHVLVSPGEQGDDTLPRGIEDFRLHLWEDDPISKTSSASIVTQVETLAWEILGGKHGPVTSFLFEGIHKYYDYILDWLTGGAYFKGEEFEPKLYARSHEHFKYFVQRVNASPVKYVAFTCWDGKEPDEPGTKGGPSHVYPDLPGKMAKRIMGEFSVVVYSQVEWHMRQPGKKAPAYWQLIPEGKVWGAAVKAPYAVTQHLPVRVEQSLPALEAALEKAWHLSQKTTPTTPA